MLKMETLYAETSGLMHQVHAGLAKLERASTQAQATELESEVASLLANINANCQRLKHLVSKEPVSRRTNSKYRLDQLTYDANHLEAALSKLGQRLTARFRAEAEREELLSRRFVSNTQTDTALAMDDFQLQENERLRSSHAQVDGLIEQSGAILEGLRDQGGYLKGVKRKMVEVAETLGMSNTVLRLIERRTAQDKLVLFAGMALTLFLMFVIYKGFKA